MGEFENLRKVGTQLSREVESELIKKKRQMEMEDVQRKRQEEQDRRRREAETQKLLRRELERKKAEEEERRREIQAQARAKERAAAREKERAKEKEKEREKPIRRPTQPTNGSLSSTSSSRNSTLFIESKPKKQEFSFDYIAKMAQQQSGPGSRDGTGMRNGGDDRRDRPGDSRSAEQARLAAIERAKVTRGISPPRDIAPRSMPKIHRNEPMAVKRRTNSGSSSGSMSSMLNIRGGGSSVNPIRKAGVQSLKDGLIALNSKKRDLRTIEEISADIRATREKDKDYRLEERQQRIREIEAERERQRQNRERAIKSAQLSRTLMTSTDAHETERAKKQAMEDDGSDGGGGSGSKRRGGPRGAANRSRSRSPPARSSKRRSRSRSSSPAAAPPRRDRSRSPAKRRRSDSPPPRRSKELDRRGDRERERYRDRDDERLARDHRKAGSSRRYSSSSSPSPPPSSSRRRRSESPARRSGGGGRGPRFSDDELDVSAVIGSLFGTKYRQRAAMEDMSDDDMEAGADDVFREEKRSARIAREEDEREARLEAEAQERARKRRLEREKASRSKDRR